MYSPLARGKIAMDLTRVVGRSSCEKTHSNDGADILPQFFPFRGG